MKKQFIAEAQRMQKLAGINEAPQWTSTSTDPSLTDRKPNPNITDPTVNQAINPDSPMGKALAKNNPKRPTKIGADRNPRSTKFYINLKVKEKYGDEDYGVIKAVKNNWEEVKNRPIKSEYIGMGTFLTDKNKNEPWYLIQFLNLDPNEKTRGNRFDEKNPYNGIPLWYPEEELENVPYGVYKQFSNKKDKWGLREDDEEIK
jgi:hypothetical protein